MTARDWVSVPAASICLRPRGYWGTLSQPVAASPTQDVRIARDSAAWSERAKRFFVFVEAHQDRAVRVAWRLIGGDAAAAEDVAQQAFYKAYRGLDRFREDANLTSWFYRILVNEARSYRRWRAIRARWLTAWTEEAGCDATEASSPDPALRRRLADALGRLSGRQREVFVLVYLEEFTVHETAQHLGTAVGTVKIHLHRALQTLRRELADLRVAKRCGGGSNR
jgi:RNA polymerase sigma-70 factor, ECF subfamily